MASRFRRFWLFVGLLGLAATDLRAAAVALEQIPTPRPSGWVIDYTSTLSSVDRERLNRLGDEIQRQTGAEMAIVVIDTTGGMDAREYATRLFNRWGVGRVRQDDGILLFAALGDRAAESVLGDGIDHVSNLQMSQAVMDREMVPRFRSGDAAGAITAGAFASSRLIFGVDTGELQTMAEPPAVVSEGLPLQSAPAPQVGFAPLEPPAGPPQFPFGSTFGVLATLGGVLGFFALLNRPPRCPKCRLRMERFEEESDDRFLEPHERLEEQLGSVDYAVWSCPGCGEVTERSHERWFSGYERCPGCRAKTLRKTSTTLEAATYDQGGRVRVDEECANCPHRSTHTHSTPRLVRPSPSRTASSSTGAGRSFSSSSSGFGGGGSSGRGASGRW
jgi:uncharacterized protein